MADTCYSCDSEMSKRDKSNNLCTCFGLSSRLRRDPPKFKRRHSTQSSLHSQVVSREMDRNLVELLLCSSLREISMEKYAISPPPSGQLLSFREFVEYYR